MKFERKQTIYQKDHFEIVAAVGENPENNHPANYLLIKTRYPHIPLIATRDAIPTLYQFVDYEIIADASVLTLKERKGRPLRALIEKLDLTYSQRIQLAHEYLQKLVIYDPFPECIQLQLVDIDQVRITDEGVFFREIFDFSVSEPVRFASVQQSIGKTLRTVLHDATTYEEFFIKQLSDGISEASTLEEIFKKFREIFIYENISSLQPQETILIFNDTTIQPISHDDVQKYRYESLLKQKKEEQEKKSGEILAKIENVDLESDLAPLSDLSSRNTPAQTIVPVAPENSPQMLAEHTRASSRMLASSTSERGSQSISETDSTNPLQTDSQSASKNDRVWEEMRNPADDVSKWTGIRSSHEYLVGEEIRVKADYPEDHGIRLEFLGLEIASLSEPAPQEQQETQQAIQQKTPEAHDTAQGYAAEHRHADLSENREHSSEILPKESHITDLAKLQKLENELLSYKPEENTAEELDFPVISEFYRSDALSLKPERSDHIFPNHTGSFSASLAEERTLLDPSDKNGSLDELVDQIYRVQPHTKKTKKFDKIMKYILLVVLLAFAFLVIKMLVEPASPSFRYDIDSNNHVSIVNTSRGFLKISAVEYEIYLGEKLLQTTNVENPNLSVATQGEYTIKMYVYDRENKKIGPFERTMEIKPKKE